MSSQCYTIEHSSTFKRDYTREARGRYGAALNAVLLPVLLALANDEPLESRHRDHKLSGDWQGYRECHIKPNLLLIYRKTDAETVRLARLGSHNELFG
jgi:mRNA interferase YafQ